MPCYKPLGAYLRTLSDGTRRAMFIRHYKTGDEQWHRPPVENGKPCEFTQIPCGKCIGCRLDYASTWADRLCVEALDFPDHERWFITLTYDDVHLPPLGKCGIHTLSPRDPQLFMKRLRAAFPGERIRFFLSGEYGDRTGRPHYHLILFGHTFSDLTYYSKNDQGDPLFSSFELDKLWGLGHCIVGQFSWNTAAYTARYVLKKIKGKDAKKMYADMGILPEFCRMSRMPGIGFNRFDSTSDSYALPNGRRAGLPKSFIEGLKKSDPDAAEAILAVRRSIGELYASERSLALGMSLPEWLKAQEKIKTTISKTLKGGLHNA